MPCLLQLERGVLIYFGNFFPKSKEDSMGLDSTVLTVCAGLMSIVVVVGLMATKIYKD